MSGSYRDQTFDQTETWNVGRGMLSHSWKAETELKENNINQDVNKVQKFVSKNRKHQGISKITNREAQSRMAPSGTDDSKNDKGRQRQ